MEARELTHRKIFIFWAPLAGTWLMMALEGPFLAAIIARLPDPKENLAAYGIAFVFGLIIEAPVINLLSASTALVRNRHTYLSLRRFTYTLNLGLTLVLLLVLTPPVFRWLSLSLLNLPEDVAHLTHVALAFLLPWPAAIGYRRFHQGVLVRHDLTRRVAYGTVLRLISMALTAVAAAKLTSLSGASIGGLALSAGVVLEAVASRIMAYEIERRLVEEDGSEAVRRAGSEWSELPMSEIVSFYTPLAMTALLAMAVQPLITFFVGRSRFAVESLAVLPVVHALTFLFRSLGLSYQEVAIALMGDRAEHFKQVRNFAFGLAIAIATCLIFIAFSPLSVLWYRYVAGLSDELMSFVLLPTMILAILPAHAVVLSLERALLVNSRRTTPIIVSTIVESSAIGLVLWLAIYRFDMIGAVAAAIALLVGRTTDLSYLLIPSLQAVRWLQGRTEAPAESPEPA